MHHSKKLPNNTPGNKKISRRGFLAASAVTAAAFTIVPRHVLGGINQKTPSETLNIAAIGVGGRGSKDVSAVSSQNIVALCDVDLARAQKTLEKYPQAKIYRDYRNMLDKEQKTIDAVVIATPDHVHAVASMMAIKMNKHVYCEKPLTHSVFEARQIAQAAKEHNVATQMGNQGQASEKTRQICEYIWAGAIGKVTQVHVWTNRPIWPQGIDKPSDSQTPPDSLDWDLWLGPAPKRLYHSSYLPFNWRGWWDFGTGALGDMGCHIIDPVFRALKLKHPVSVSVSSTKLNKQTYPHASTIPFEYPARGDMPPVSMAWYDGGIKPPRPTELEDGRSLGNGGALFIGDKGKMLDNLIIPEEKRAQYPVPPATTRNGSRPGDRFVY